MKNSDLNYLEVCTAELGEQHQFYFDSSDIIYMLQGVNRFYKKNGRDHIFKHDFFKKNEVIVHALAFGKYLKNPVKLLPPHQAELSKKVRNDDLKELYLGNVSNVLQFFLERDLHFFEKLKDITLNTVTDPDNHFIREWIDEKAKEIFKAIYFSFHASFVDRLEYIFSNQVVVTQDYDIGEMEIKDDRLFKELHNYFNRRRPSETFNNFNDVAAFMYLAKLVRSYNLNKSPIIPVYFDSNNYSDDLPKSLLDEYFSVEAKSKDSDGVKIKNSVFRKWNYFQLYALLDSNNESAIANDDLLYIDFAETKKRLETLLSSFLQKNSSNQAKQAGEQYEKEVAEINDLISNYIKVDFYKTIINIIFKKHLSILNSILEDFQKKQLEPESGELVKKQGEIILKHLNFQIDELTQESTKVYDTIGRRLMHVKQLNDKLGNKGEELDVFKHYSLFRFFIPKEFQGSIRSMFSNDALLSEDEDRNITSRITIWNLYYKNIHSKLSQKSSIAQKDVLEQNELYLLYSAFWILSLHDKISSFKYQPNYLKGLAHSLLMLIGASLNRSINDSQSGEPVIAELKVEYNTIIEILESRIDNQSNETDAEIKVALSYLYFHLWLQKGNNLLLSSSVNDDSANTNNPADNENYKAINYAKEVLHYYKKKSDKSNPILLYAYNIFIYFVIETGNNQDFLDIQSYVNEFTLKKDARDWHFRYDDTLARYYHRMSLLYSKKEEKLNCLNDALIILDKTIDDIRILTGKDVEEVKAYHMFLKNVKMQTGIQIF